jgi:hypothetical protein
VLSTDIVERVATGLLGPVFCCPCQTSHRAEAFEIILVLCFLIRIAKYTGMFEPWTGLLVPEIESVWEGVLTTEK